MPNNALTNITAGEISQSALGRPDIARYPNACLRLENFLLTPTGMWSFRPGFGLMGLPKTASSPVMLRSFRFSDLQGNQIELGEKYARVWHTLGLVVDGGGAPIEMVTPFPASQLGLLGFCQSADFLFVVHETLGMFTIQRAGLTAWSFQSFALKDGPYGKQNADGALSLTTTDLGGGSFQIDAGGFGAKPPFGPGDEGRLIRINNGAAWYWFIVQTYNSPTQVIGQVQSPPGVLANGPYTIWRLGLYSNRLGWPAALRIHEQRLVLAGPAAIPDRIDGSAIAGFDDFAPRSPITEDGPWAYALGQDGVDRIVALGQSNDLLALTTAASHRMSGDSTGTAITPTSVFEKPISDDGAKRIPPVNVGNATAYVDNFGLSIRALSFDIRYQNYAPDDLTLLADHMCWLDPSSPGFQALQWQAKPFGNLWTIRGNGELAGAIYNPTQNVLGWHRHPMGMPVGDNWPNDFGNAYAAPVVESISIMRGPTYHELWAVVRRDLPDRTLRTIERMGRPGLWETPFQSQSFLDCSLQLSNTPSATLTPTTASGNGVHLKLTNVTGGFKFIADHVGRWIKRRWNAGVNIRGRTIWKTAIARITQLVSDTEVIADIMVPFPDASAIAAGSWGLTVSTVNGLGHLEGLKVAIVSDGRVCGAQVVLNGAVTLDVPGWEITVGLPYVGMMVGVPIDPGPQPAVGMGRNVRIEKINARLLNSIGGEFASIGEQEEQPRRWEKLVAYTEGQAAPSASPEPFTGIKKMWGAGEWTKEGQIAMRQTAPLPFNVQMVISHLYAPFVQP